MNPTIAFHACMNVIHYPGPSARLGQFTALLNLQNIDLNLLVALDLLLDERSVTRAATRARVTQSAMSHTLRRLRAHFDDPLLVRAGGEMQPTILAERLVHPVKVALSAVREALTPEPPFEPLTSRREFTIASTDFVETVVLPPLLNRISEEAPHVNLRVVPLQGRRVTQRLETGDVDVAISIAQDLDEGQARRRLLLRQEFACVVRRGHPSVGEELDLDTFVRLPHLLIAPRGRGKGAVDVVLEDRGLSRRVAVRTASFLLAPWIVSSSDMVLTAPRGLCEATAELFSLDVHDPPLPVPGFEIYLGWHERTHESASHKWLRALLVDVTHELR